MISCALSEPLISAFVVLMGAASACHHHRFSQRARVEREVDHAGLIECDLDVFLRDLIEAGA